MIDPKSGFEAAAAAYRAKGAEPIEITLRSRPRRLTRPLRSGSGKTGSTDKPPLSAAERLERFLNKNGWLHQRGQYYSLDLILALQELVGWRGLPLWLPSERCLLDYLLFMSSRKDQDQRMDSANHDRTGNEEVVYNAFKKRLTHQIFYEGCEMFKEISGLQVIPANDYAGKVAIPFNHPDIKKINQPTRINRDVKALQQRIEKNGLWGQELYDTIFYMNLDDAVKSLGKRISVFDPRHTRARGADGVERVSGRKGLVRKFRYGPHTSVFITKPGMTGPIMMISYRLRVANLFGHAHAIVRDLGRALPDRSASLDGHLETFYQGVAKDLGEEMPKVSRMRAWLESTRKRD